MFHLFLFVVAVGTNIDTKQSQSNKHMIVTCETTHTKKNKQKTQNE